MPWKPIPSKIANAVAGDDDVAVVRTDETSPDPEPVEPGVVEALLSFVPIACPLLAHRKSEPICRIPVRFSSANLHFQQDLLRARHAKQVDDFRSERLSPSHGVKRS